MSIFNYLDYRPYIRGTIKALPKQGRGELAKLARHLNISSTLLSQIMSGSRSFSQEQALQLAEYFGQSEVEQEYGLLLIQLELASSHKLRELVRHKMAKLRNEALQVSKQIRSERNLNEEERVRFYSSWTYSVVHLFCSTQKAGVSVEEIMARFSLSRARTLEVLRFLCDVGLCREEKSRYQMTTQSTFVESGSPHLKRHHMNWRVKALEKQESLADNELMFTAQVSLSKTDFEKLREMAVEFIKQVSAVVKDSPAEDVANLNLDFFIVK